MKGSSANDPPGIGRDVSIIIPARDAAGTIDAALRSLAPDRHLIAEIVLVDDGSVDQTQAVALESARWHGLPLTIVPVQLGSPGAARNAGIAVARGRLLFFLDADDHVEAGGLSLLHGALAAAPGAGLAVGANIRRTAGKPDKLKVPHGYTGDRLANVGRYLRNELWPIAMGSALVAADATADVRFPASIGLDEDTCYWAALLTRADVATVEAPVLLYRHNERRMAKRFVRDPRKTYLSIALELDKLAAFGVPNDSIRWRKAWIAQRIARQLIKHLMFSDAAGMMRAVVAHPAFRGRWKTFQYLARIRAGRVRYGSREAAADASPAPRRRTLVLTYDPAFPPTSGADLRNFQNAAAAARLGEVRLVSVRAQPGKATPRDEKIGVTALGVEGEPRSPSLGWRRSRIESRIPRMALTRLKALVREFRPDTVIFEGVALFRLMRPLRQQAQLMILDMHNVESEIAAKIGMGTTAGILSGGDAEGARRLERKALTLVDRVWVCSQQDRERVAALHRPGVPVDIVPNGIPRAEDIPARLPPAPPRSGAFPVVLFAGHLGYQPNVQAAERLARQIMPRIRRSLPEARLVLAGRYPKPAVRALALFDGVELLENPPDLTPLLCAAHISIVPLAAGGGTRIKILEAMAWGVPVVATPLAVEGLGLIDGDEVLLADVDEQLAEAAVALCLDPARMERLRATGHRTAWSRFGPKAIDIAIRAGLGMDGEG